MSLESYRILIVDDDENIRKALARLFPDNDTLVVAVGNGKDALDACRRHSFQVALVDLMMHGMNGEELLAKMQVQVPETAVIILTAHGSVEAAVRLIKAGAYDFFTKPFSTEVVQTKVRRICHTKSLEEENLRLKSELTQRYKYDNLIGSSPAMQRLYEIIARVSQNSSTVLIQGESGTGKEQIARAIHFSGLRKDEPFVPVDCGSISPALIESELFGHKRGAFTGAHTSTEGLLRNAGKGTIFFDEIGEIPLSVQASLLRALQEREVRPVGSTEVHPITARVIAATNRDLEKQTKAGEFREDLFYRLNVVLIKVPPLRKRLDDIPLLARFLLHRLDVNEQVVPIISPQALRVLEGYRWPGNIRELENALEHALTVGDGKTISPRDLSEKIRTSSGVHIFDPMILGNGSLESFEKQALLNALKRSNGNRRQAANILEIGEATLYRKLKKFGVDKEFI